MDAVSTAIVVAVVAGLMLLGIGIVVNQLLRLRRYLRRRRPIKSPVRIPSPRDNPTDSFIRMTAPDVAAQ